MIVTRIVDRLADAFVLSLFAAGLAVDIACRLIEARRATRTMQRVFAGNAAAYRKALWKYDITP